VPLAVAERIERPAEDVLAVDMECQVEGAADGEHAEVTVKHEQGFAHRVKDGLRERPRIFNVLERFSHGLTRWRLRLLADLSHPFWITKQF
jgi:hypothetical protein